MINLTKLKLNLFNNYVDEISGIKLGQNFINLINLTSLELNLGKN